MTRHRKATLPTFPNTATNKQTDLLEEMDRQDADFEAAVELTYSEDYNSLVTYFEKRLADYPDETRYVQKLADACILNKEHQRALTLLTELYQQEPENLDTQGSILEALFAQGKDETYFDWKELPSVLRINSNLLNFIFEHLKPKRKPRTVAALYCIIRIKGYCAFSEDDLTNAIRNDNRFLVEENPFVEIRVKRGNRR